MKDEINFLPGLFWSWCTIAIEILSKTAELCGHTPQVTDTLLLLFEQHLRTVGRGPSWWAEHWPVNLTMPLAWEEK